MKSLELDGASLIVGGRSLWLERDGQRVPAARLRYDEGRLRDQIEVSGHSYDVPRGQGKALKRLLAEHRLRHAEALAPVVGHAFVEDRDALETLGLEAWLQPGELVLAYLHTSTDATVESELGPSHAVPWRFVWTDRRAALLAVGPLGDLVAWPVDAYAVQERTGRDLVLGRGPEGELEWRATLGNEGHYAAIAPVLGASPEARLRAVIEASRSAPHRSAAGRLLEHDVDPRAPVERALLAGESPPIDDAFVASMDPAAMVAWAFEGHLRAQLIEALQAHDAASAHALALSEVEWREARSSDPVNADLRRAAHLRKAGDEDEARRVLEACLEELPAPEVAELVPPGDPSAHVGASAREG